LLKSHFPKVIYKPGPSEKLLKKPSELRWNLSRINQLEDHLLKHPLILFPYLQKYLPTKNPSIRLKTEEFCRWIFELDQEETDSPQPKAIAELFISPYESRPTGHATLLMREINRPTAALRDLVRKTDGAPETDGVFTLGNATSQNCGDTSAEQHI
ncbi:hypothetical protein X801_10164, partial [Opisthorchis viverrini]